MRMNARSPFLFCLVVTGLSSFAGHALAAPAMPVQAQSQDAPVPSSCLAMAQAVPAPMKASFTQVRGEEGTVTFTYSGHSTYRIDTPGGITIATDFSGVYGAEPTPDVVTMNKAHRTHYTETPNSAIGHVLRGWNAEGVGAARHAVVVDDVYIRNVPTDIRNWDGGMERDGNSIFIFEVAGLCIGHLGHLHHDLTNAHYAAIGRLDVVMVPVDGGMTSSLANIGEITQRLYSSVILPMHRHSTPLSEFTARMGKTFAVQRLEGTTISFSLRTLPRQPTIFVPQGL
jgi:L-ascorbate metabolism protein UlaG (beta-lactamase superfamily)